MSRLRVHLQPTVPGLTHGHAADLLKGRQVGVGRVRPQAHQGDYIQDEWVYILVTVEGHRLVVGQEDLIASGLNTQALQGSFVSIA